MWLLLQETRRLDDDRGIIGVQGRPGFFFNYNMTIMKEKCEFIARFRAVCVMSHPLILTVRSQTEHFVCFHLDQMC